MNHGIALPLTAVAALVAAGAAASRRPGSRATRGPPHQWGPEWEDNWGGWQRDCKACGELEYNTEPGDVCPVRRRRSLRGTRETTVGKIRGSSARGRGGRFVPEWVAGARRSLEFAGFGYDAGMGGFIWRPEGGQLGDPGHQYAIYGGAGFRQGTWSAWYWGLGDRSEAVPVPRGATQPMHAIDGVQEHWRRASARRRSLRGSRALPDSLDVDGGFIGGATDEYGNDLLFLVEAGSAPGGYTTLRWPWSPVTPDDHDRLVGTWDEIGAKLHEFKEKLASPRRRSLRGARAGKKAATRAFVLYIDEELNTALYTIDSFLEVD